MSQIPNRSGPSRPKLCRNGCGTYIHFNPDNALGRGPNNGWVPLHNIQTPSGIVEAVHNCAGQNNSAGSYATPAQYPMGPVAAQPGVAAQQSGSAVPSVTQMLLQVAQENLAVGKEILAVSREQLNLLKALHPELNPQQPLEEHVPGQEETPAEYQPADSLEEPPK